MVEAAPEQENETRFTLIQDPIPDRPLDDQQCPKLITKSIDDSLLWKEDGLPDWKLLKDFLLREGPLTK